MSRVIDISEALAIIKTVYATFGWNPGGSSTRDQRNAWWASAVAVVHYGHPTLNPAGGDPRWCIKDAGGGRPQSDDIIVDRHTRAYFDLMPNAGTDHWSWNLGAHSEPLPAEQNVYPPSQSSLPGIPVPSPTPDPAPTPPPIGGGPSEVDRLILEALGHVHAKLDEIRRDQQVLSAQVGALHALVDTNTGKVGTWMTEQAGGVVQALSAEIAAKAGEIKNAQCILRPR